MAGVNFASTFIIIFLFVMQGAIKGPYNVLIYRYLNNLDVNIHEVSEDTFYVIDDATDDLDSIEKVELILTKLGKNNG